MNTVDNTFPGACYNWMKLAHNTELSLFVSTVRMLVDFPRPSCVYVVALSPFFLNTFYFRSIEIARCVLLVDSQEAFQEGWQSCVRRQVYFEHILGLYSLQSYRLRTTMIPGIVIYVPNQCTY